MQALVYPWVCGWRPQVWVPARVSTAVAIVILIVVVVVEEELGVLGEASQHWWAGSGTAKLRASLCKT